VDAGPITGHLRPELRTLGLVKEVVVRIDIEQARKRAKELVKAGRFERLADAQREIARELGYPSWPALIRAVDRPTAERFVREVDHWPDRALELLDAAPDLRGDPWVALSLGQVPDGLVATAPGGPLAQPPLFYVARSRLAPDTVPAARLLLDRGADPNGPAGDEWTNLSIAGSRGDAPLVRLLLEAGAEPNDNDSLYHAVEPADDGCLRLVLEHGAVVRGTNALWHALDFDRFGPVQLLLEHGGDPNESAEWPALHHAVTRGRGPDYLRVLVAHGARLDDRARDGRTPLQLALRRGRDDLVETLLELGADVATVDDQDRALSAVARGERPATEIRLDHDARDVLIELAMRDLHSLQRVVDAVGAGFTAGWGGGPRGSLLHQAAWFGRPDFVRLLLDRGAEPDARATTEYATPLGWAAVGSRYSPAHPNDSFSSPDGDYVGVAELLVAAGARVEPKFTEMAVPPLADWLAGL
jgi:ankyrin repeat protein